MPPKDTPYVILFQGKIPQLCSQRKIDISGGKSGEHPKGLRDALLLGEAGIVYSDELMYGEGPSSPSIAVYPICGTVRYSSDYWWRFGTKEFVETIKAADENPSVIGHMLYIDSPGGEVFYAKEAFEAIRNLKKPCYAFIESIAASCGYYFACAAKKVIAMSPNTYVGCIGVMSVYWDDTKALKDEGYEKHEYYSNYTPLKNKVFNDAAKGEGDEFVKRFLDPMAYEFIDSVKSARPDIDPEGDALKGETYLAKEAMELHLIDEIADFDTAFNELLSICDESPNQPSVNINDIDFSL